MIDAFELEGYGPWAIERVGDGDRYLTQGLVYYAWKSKGKNFYIKNDNSFHHKVDLQESYCWRLACSMYCVTEEPSEHRACIAAKRAQEKLRSRGNVPESDLPIKPEENSMGLATWNEDALCVEEGTLINGQDARKFTDAAIVKMIVAEQAKVDAL
tara:strand:+ start:280 stop:747 length:468 start_codon:yes stop_codon:yes gene_type:complete